MAKTQQPFWLGGASASMAACFTHPLDRTKYCIQVLSSRQPMLKALRTFASRDGILSLWSGLSAAILRQTTYSTARFALYDVMVRKMQPRTGGKLSAGWTVFCAGAAGGLAGVIGNPTEIVLVRMCADGVKAPAQRYHYPNAVSGMIKIGKEEGLGTFTKGLGPNVVRSVLMNVCQIGVYTAAKQRLIANKVVPLVDGISVHIAASLIAGTVATTVCAPADVLKSRMQSAASTKGKRPGIATVIAESLKKEGPRFLMKGWTPAWLRVAPHTILTFMFLEQLQKLASSKTL